MGREGGGKILFIFIFLIGIAVSVGGCDLLPIGGGKKEQKATPKAPPKVTPRKKNPAPLPQAAQEVERDYVYDPTGKRDPFQPFIAMQTPVKPTEEEVPVTVLQTYDLSQLKLVAILVGTGEGRAMVEDSYG